MNEKAQKQYTAGLHQQHPIFDGQRRRIPSYPIPSRLCHENRHRTAARDKHGRPPRPPPSPGVFS